MRLCIFKHLKTVLQRTMRDIRIVQIGCNIRLDPAVINQRFQSFQRFALPNFIVSPATDNLPCLGEKLDLANTTAPKLHIVPRHQNCPVQAFVLANTKAHIVCVLNGREVQIFPPNERLKTVEKCPARINRPRTRARLDERGTLPRSTEAFVISLRRFHRHAHRRRGRIGPQAQICPKHISATRHSRQ